MVFEVLCLDGRTNFYLLTTVQRMGLVMQFVAQCLPILESG